MLRKTFFVMFAVLLFMGSVFAQGDNADDKEAAAATADVSKPAGRFTPTKAQIQAGQEYLKANKFYSGEASGKYNEETRSAIRAFQKQSGMAITGNFNQATLEKMNIPVSEKQKGAAPAASPAKSDAGATSTDSAAAPTRLTLTAGKAAPATKAAANADAPASKSAGATDAAAATPKRAAPFQATKEQIIALQNVLIKGKMFTGEANGERSEALKEAVKKYQEANGLKATGGINAVTLEKAGIPLTEKQRGQAAAPATSTSLKTVD